MWYAHLLQTLLTGGNSQDRQDFTGLGSLSSLAMVGTMPLRISSRVLSVCQQVSGSVELSSEIFTEGDLSRSLREHPIFLKYQSSRSNGYQGTTEPISQNCKRFHANMGETFTASIGS